jgi:hypothetical protein
MSSNYFLDKSRECIRHALMTLPKNPTRAQIAMALNRAYPEDWLGLGWSREALEQWQLAKREILRTEFPKFYDTEE